ncbi:flagellar filament capping protein FliD [Sulfuricurvum sp.]|uniref:flagellar filament capping protein FliD n=1 Tax=Sulfuricurvum sp. TaxID=2025608 RepID=UPI00286D9AE9|nr:flagellar filament capping protein FliD [Sulfuricurvum sp.]
MAGTVSSLGIGSSVLTADVIDKLKAADTANIVTPIDNKITLQAQKDSALDLLNSLLGSFKSSVSSLSDDTLYQKRTVSGNSDAVSVSALSGSAIQSFSISDTVMAKKSILESGSFSSTTATVSSGSGTMSLAIDGETFNMDYTSSTTLTDLKESINTKAGAKVTASILQTGANEYHLVLTSKETGADQTISLSDSAGGTLKNELKTYDVATNPTGVQSIQTASDASFKYNGISITRASNSVSDLIIGVTINLLQDGGSTNIGISQNTTAISDEMSNLATSYNTLTKQLDEMTLADLDNGKVGIFNGDNTIKSIKREITKMLTSMNSDGNSLAQYGIGLGEDGTMTFTKSEFDTKMSSDATGLEAFFSGSTSESGEYTEGIFGYLDELLDSYTSSSGLMSNLLNGSDTETKALKEERTRAADLLTARYDTMTARFAMYDAIISKLNSQFSSLQMQIDAMANSSS